MRLRAGRAAGAGELTRSRGHGVSTARGQAGRGLAGSARRVRRTQMRKTLLGTTAVVGAALLAPEMAAAQQAPTVRIGGYFRAYYGYTQQTSPHVTGNVGGTVGANGVITGGSNVFQAAQTGDVGI